MSNEEYIALQRLTKSEDFSVLTKVLDVRLTLYGEQLLGSSESSDFHFLRGKILGIRTVVEFVDELRREEKDFAARQLKREHSSTTDPERRQLATFGTPSWTANRTRTN